MAQILSTVSMEVETRAPARLVGCSFIANGVGMIIFGLRAVRPQGDRGQRLLGLQQPCEHHNRQASRTQGQLAPVRTVKSGSGGVCVGVWRGDLADRALER